MPFWLFRTSCTENFHSMGRTYGVNTILKKQYQTIPITEEWEEAIGLPEINFRMLVWGPSGSGKTTFVLKLCKELSRHGKVYYNSTEQGEGKTIQDAFKYCKMEEVEPGKFMLGDRDTFDEMLEKLKRNRSKFIVIDSLQYMNLTTEQYKRLIRRYPRKAFIIISWEGSGGNPKGEYAKAIRYMVDIKTYVKNGRAISQSRFGVTRPYQAIAQKAKPGDQLTMKIA